MIKRIGYALGQAWQHRKLLRAYNQDPARQLDSVLTLDLSAEKALGIKVLALDMDGVLTCYGEEQPSLAIESWLNSCLETFGQDHVFILTNKPTQARAQYFIQNCQGIELIFPKQKKPYPDGINQIVAKTLVDPKEVLVIDDRLLTGILAAILAGARARYITKPLICLKLRPIQELFFIVLRKIERLVF